jgi:ribosomal protein S21
MTVVVKNNNQIQRALSYLQRQASQALQTFKKQMYHVSDSAKKHEEKSARAKAEKLRKRYKRKKSHRQAKI